MNTTLPTQPHWHSLTIPVRIPLNDLQTVPGKPIPDGLQSMERCPRFNDCSAPICPIDPSWSKRTMQGGDRVCTWMMEMAKAGPEAQCVPEDIRKGVASGMSDILVAVGLAPIRSALKRAALTGSKRSPQRVAQFRVVTA